MNGSKGILLTDGRDHQPLDWALATADHLVFVKPKAAADLQIAARELELSIARCLVDHHAAVQRAESSRLASFGDAAVEYHPDAKPHLDAALDSILAAAAASPFKSDWEDKAWQDQVSKTLDIHFSSSMWNARSWYADKHPDGENAKIFRVARALPTSGGDRATMTITTAFPTSAKAEMGQAFHNYTTTSGNVFKMALIIPSPAGTYGAASTNYSNITGNSDEVPNGSGYTTGGFAWTAAQNITPLTSGTSSYWSWSVNPSWTSATFSTAGCMIYNTSSSNKAVYVGSFGGTQTVTAGTLTVLLPTNAAGTSILQLN